MVDKIGITGVVGAMILAGTIGGVTVDKIKDKKVTPINEAWGVVLQDSCGNEYHFTDIQYGAVREALFDYYEDNNSVDVCDWGLLASALNYEVEVDNEIASDFMNKDNGESKDFIKFMHKYTLKVKDN